MKLYNFLIFFKKINKNKMPSNQINEIGVTRPRSYSSTPNSLEIIY